MPAALTLLASATDNKQRTTDEFMSATRFGGCYRVEEKPSWSPGHEGLFFVPPRFAHVFHQL
jgi:hypothetical protein